ncbi:transcription factor ETV7 isoform X3 [Hippoglossus hippoglossus]|uniref:transcription factor ETV7 isoform X3 n=1 Tax=Hippoglossus hippoglossus TaxID=8267 RepID=UPI00148BA882|nr:transcription factor ETV7 isoform X3 [Hippoglossus hippoglossus]XP_035014489.2 transcription factor ETV7 isoform X2 [Hippoglossus stenolepis]
MENVSLSPLDKQENKANTLSPTMHGEQANKSPSVLHSPAHHPQGDLWHLPGRLRINPSLWDKEDVAHWLHWAQREYSLRRSEKGRFEMNGRALCLLTKEDFRRRCPSSGDVLYEILQCVKQQRRGAVCDPQNTPPSLTPENVHSQGQVSCQVPALSVQEPQPPRVNDTKAVPTSPHSKAQCPPPTKSISQEPLNLSSRERSPVHKVNGRIPECRLLWDYVYQLLCDDRYQQYIRWEDRDSLVFRVVDPNGLACLWGNHKNRDNMTYEKMSRALRHYYKLNIIKKERGQKLLFRFLKLPHDIRKKQADPAESPEPSSPLYGNLPYSSPTHETREDHFEISPDRMSPQPPLTDAPVR